MQLMGRNLGNGITDFRDEVQKMQPLGLNLWFGINFFVQKYEKSAARVLNLLFGMILFYGAAVFCSCFGVKLKKIKNFKKKLAI